MSARSEKVPVKKNAINYITQFSENKDKPTRYSDNEYIVYAVHILNNTIHSLKPNTCEHFHEGSRDKHI